MKSISAALFVGVAAAGEAYGNYKPSSSSSSSKIGYTTIHPGHGYEPVTVTSQYQTIPTYAAGTSTYYVWVSTVITGYNGLPVTITKTDQDVTLYSTQSTITHYRTEPASGYAQPTGAYQTGSGGYYPKSNGTGAYPSPVVKPYYELYQKVHEAEYKDLGPKALPNYPGSPLYQGEKDKQPVKVKEYQNGKWNNYKHVFDYGVPKPSATTFANPGTYTIPAYDKTVKETYTAPAQATTTCEAGKAVTYGGYTTSVTKPTTITATYPAYETKGTGENKKTETVYKTKTVTCPNAGKYEIQKPTTTSFTKPTTFVYPTVTVYPPGVYHHTRETVTVTKSNQPYTCSYQSTDKPTNTPSYPTSTSTSAPSYPTGTTTSYDSYPTSTPSGSYPTVTKDNTYPSETPSTTGPHGPDPSSDYVEPAEAYGTASAGYVKRGGMLQRRKAEPEVKKPAGKRVILV
ncbi:hypothetical protein B0J11DRAFT_542081 [Dendryphion nanum]|uniref:Uncharacterized protein n=1 Tax=Dendryphion nanum TaxID=256645 RepID=A0A9P9I9B7_9PLEO|nr:hypothetical protein B0J11DRAFT_542081 [Dendryphion nanum]